MLLLIGLCFAGLAGVLTSRALQPVGRTSRRVAHVERYGLAARRDLVSAERGTVDDGVDQVRSVASRIGVFVARRLAPVRVERLRRNLLAAGRYNTSAEAFLGMQGLSVLAALAFSPVIVGATGGKLSTSLIIIGLVLYVGLAIPPSRLARQARARLDAVDREMPELVDVLVVAVEAGLGLVAAMDRASARVKGPLGDELRLVLQEHGLGATVGVALGNFGERCDSAAVRSFTRTLVQGERLGVSIGQLLRATADDMRKRRVATANEAAHRAPVKIMFPLVFCIFPALMIILLAPAGMSLLHGLGNS